MDYICIVMKSKCRSKVYIVSFLCIAYVMLKTGVLPVSLCILSQQLHVYKHDALDGWCSFNSYSGVLL